MNVDPMQTAAQYRERIARPYLDMLPAAAVASIEEHISGPCTVEIAAATDSVPIEEVGLHVK